ncbi:twitching motility protein PilT [Pseudomonas syringae]|uniref:ATPase, T2SS/T4P/T4SS family n=1 Tax=Pseudomonas syringae group TaxID=136849 RepID=UPI0006B8FE43|nr:MULTISPECIES: ATPase, T2SS/T4P/T4SS family [Pseudomonas syringae group]KPB80607.1 Type II secretion system protein E [Pseudomonas syringae pv. maculicola]MBI6846159.1 Flp pilus assembly complex ATPase component TadA [Pseudomonas syringae]MBX6511250.1 Flp pilus assembly complex ATPase component TadA [Pseudomonas syringae pv. tomato]MDC6489675.1 Flp pilus assembly complex ATPase component TadA [Pseudomonas syringae]MDC6493615.1 Flp pilus assembly complex ATPase component TadA [Pseudomonas syr
MSPIIDTPFVDLYLGPDFTDVKGLDGQSGRVEAPDSWKESAQLLREECSKHFEVHQDPEFSLIKNGMVLRVTQIPDAFGQAVFVLRKSNAQLRPFDQLGFPEDLVTSLLAKNVRGLVIFCGEMGTGKTSSAASLVIARLIACGGIALAAEDPAETDLNGRHGPGRCIQMQVSRRNGGYEEALMRGLRSGADMMLIGEIRDTPTAVQAVRAAINGLFIITTVHAGTVPQAIERVATLAEPEISNVRSILSQGLVAVIALALDGEGSMRHLKIKSLSLTGHDGPGIREKIRSNQIAMLTQDLEYQSNRSLWG